MVFPLLGLQGFGVVSTTCGATYNIPNPRVLVLLTHFVDRSKNIYLLFISTKSVLNGHSEPFAFLQTFLNFLHSSIKVGQNLDQNLSFPHVINTTLQQHWIP